MFEKILVVSRQDMVGECSTHEPRLADLQPIPNDARSQVGNKPRFDIPFDFKRPRNDHARELISGRPCWLIFRVPIVVYQSFATLLTEESPSVEHQLLAEVAL